jgi:hypothetical protein
MSTGELIQMLKIYLNLDVTRNLILNHSLVLIQRSTDLRFETLKEEEEEEEELIPSADEI